MGTNSNGHAFDVSCLIFIAIFSVLIISNIICTFKYSIHKHETSMFIIVFLIILDIVRLLTVVAAMMIGVENFLTDELLLRLSYDLPVIMFFCLNVALYFQFKATYNVLENPA